MPGSCAHVCPRTVGIANPSGAASDSVADGRRPSARRTAAASARRPAPTGRAPAAATGSVAPTRPQAAPPTRARRHRGRVGRRRSTRPGHHRGGGAGRRDGAAVVPAGSDVAARRPRAPESTAARGPRAPARGAGDVGGDRAPGACCRHVAAEDARPGPRPVLLGCRGCTSGEPDGGQLPAGGGEVRPAPVEPQVDQHGRVRPEGTDEVVGPPSGDHDVVQLVPRRGAEHRGDGRTPPRHRVGHDAFGVAGAGLPVAHLGEHPPAVALDDTGVGRPGKAEQGVQCIRERHHRIVTPRPLCAVGDPRCGIVRPGSADAGSAPGTVCDRREEPVGPPTLPRTWCLSPFSISPPSARLDGDGRAGHQHEARPARRGSRVPALLGGGAPRDARYRELVAGRADRPPGRRHRAHPRRLGRCDVAQPPAARHRRAVRHARRAAPRAASTSASGVPPARTSARRAPCAAAPPRSAPTTSPSSSVSCSPTSAATGPSRRCPRRARTRRCGCSGRAATAPSWPGSWACLSPSPTTSAARTRCPHWSSTGGCSGRRRCSTQPYALIAASVLCAPDDAEAHRLALPSALQFLQLRLGRPGPVPTPEEAAAYPYTPEERDFVEDRLAGQVIGSPETVRTGVTRAGRADGGGRADGRHEHPRRRGPPALVPPAHRSAGPRPLRRRAARPPDISGRARADHRGRRPGAPTRIAAGQHVTVGQPASSGLRRSTPRSGDRRPGPAPRAGRPPFDRATSVRRPATGGHSCALRPIRPPDPARADIPAAGRRESAGGSRPPGPRAPCWRPSRPAASAGGPRSRAAPRPTR